MIHSDSNQPLRRTTALVVVSAMLAPMLLAGCGGQPQSNPIPAPVDDTRGGRMAPPVQRQPPVAQRPGMSTKQKVMLLAGAAALYYLYRKHQQKAQAKGQTIQYYRSKNGRIYYRDPQTHQAHWVTPPQSIQVPMDEARQYSDMQGYNNQRTGRGIDDLFPLASP